MSRLVAWFRATSPVVHQVADVTLDLFFLLRVALETAEVIKDGGCSLVADTFLRITHAGVSSNPQFGREGLVEMLEPFVSEQSL